MEEVIMEPEKLSLMKGNRLIKKRFDVLMKEHKDFWEEKEPNHFCRVKDHFLQCIWIWIDNSGYGPRFQCLIQPTFLPEVGNTCYATGECIRYREMLPKEKQKIDFYPVRVDLPNEKPWYPADKLDEVWENNKYLIEEIVIPHMDRLDFDRTIEMLQSGKDELFKIYNWYPKGKIIMQFTLAVACLLKEEYQEGYQKLLGVRDYFYEETERLIGSCDSKVFEEAKRLICIGDRKSLEEARRLTGYYDIFDLLESYDMKAKADYIMELLTILEQKMESWEDRLKKRIEDTEKCSIEWLGIKI